MKSFLPVSKEDMKNRGWNELDFVYIIGDAYVDHPSFGHAIISRVLEANGYKVGIISQPDWKDVNAFKRLGKPRLGFLISSGNVDSMVNHYSVFKKRRKKDAYSPGGKSGSRPDRAAIVYASKVREAYKDVPVIIGGLEGSLRRFAHYDYWDDKIRRSILMDAKADLVIYGMGEKPIVEVADALNAGIKIKDIQWIKGTVFKSNTLENIQEYVMLPSYESIVESKKSYAKSFMIQYKNNNHFCGKTLVEQYDANTFVIQNPPPEPMNKEEMDAVYALPYMGTYHPMYEELGGVPALEEVKFSITSTRGCFGNCSFCALAYHQGRVVQPRSRASIIEEGKKLSQREDFKGYIHDVGGPTANFRQAACEKQRLYGTCTEKDCLFPEPCGNLNIDHREYIDILRELRKIKGVKKVFVRSGVRYDYAIYDKSKEFLEELCRYHISGYLKVAPEHVSDEVLRRMGKPSKAVFDKFVKEFKNINKRIGKEQYIIPYFISSHPGSTLQDAVELATYMKENGFIPEQVQDFYPTPGTLATCMYFTGYDPRNMEEVYVPKSKEEKAMQRALLQFNRPENYDLVYKALMKAGRKDLIGFDNKSLIKPRNRRNSDGDNKKAPSNIGRKRKRI
ncbi:MAG: YgiQ family radical SAM protein [Clostridiales bacterium]|nr:YgiQ family radical SAM protein [Clostridiales bacterium]